MRFHSNWAFIEQEFDCSIRDHFLMAVRSLDNPKAVTPFLLETSRQRFALFLHVEKGNVEAARLPADITPVYYRPYFTFEPPDAGRSVHRTLVDAVEHVAEGDRNILIDPATPLAVASELQGRFAIALEDAPEPGTVTLREVRCSETVARLQRGRLEARKAATRLLVRSPIRDRLLPYLGFYSDDRFSKLDQAIEKEGFTGIVLSSTLNVQEIAGVPVRRKQRPLAAIYIPGQSCAWVMEPGCASDGRQFPSPRSALNHLVPTGGLGIETEDIGVALGHALGLENRDWRSADKMVRQWRDECALPDLPYYIIATRTTRYAIEAALSFAAEALKRSLRVTEMDSYALYLSAMREFAQAALPGLRVSRTLTNFHSGSRTIYPANPTAYQLDRSINTLKIDAGCLLFDSEGVLLGCSDIARTLALSPASQDLYAIFESSVRHRLIPGARAGRVGAELHTEATEAIWGEHRQLAGNPLFVNLAQPSHDYDRDVGHLLGKNNLAHLRFVEGENQKLREGMIACCEFQWPVNAHAVAYEDTCLVTPTGGLNITSDEE